MKVIEIGPHHPVSDDTPAGSAATSVPSGVAAENMSSPSGLNRILKMIPVDLIDSHPLAPREVYTPQVIKERADDLRSQNQHDPIHVIPHPGAEGRYIICDGWTRVQACRDHQVFDELLAEIHPELTLQESAWFGYEQNECRQQHCDLDRAMFYEKLQADGASAQEIARRAQLSNSMMTFYRAYSKLPEEILVIVRQHPFKFSANVAYQLHRLYERCGLSKAVCLAMQFAEADQPVRWLAGQVQSEIQPSSQKKTEKSKHVKYANGFYKQRGDEFDLSIKVPSEKRVAFAEALEKLLDTVSIQPPAVKETPETTK